MMRFIFQLFCVLLSVSAFAEGNICRFDMKDYDSPGFGIPYRSGFHIKGRFGCIYRCACADGRHFKVTHVLEESYFDLDVFSNDTGGPSRAKWFICPHSVQWDSWKPYRDELGRIIAYNVAPDYSDFPAELLSSTSPQIREWEQKTCQSHE